MACRMQPLTPSMTDRLDPSPAADGLFQPWRGVDARPVLAGLDAHSLHSYFAISPESPDERSVLLFRSSRADAHVGDIVIVDRVTHQATTLARDIECEDGHRQANQQWTSGGRYVVFMAWVDGDFQVERVDTRDLSRTVLARGRQLGWGQPGLDVVPLYGPHWKLTPYQDIELLDVRTGEIRTLVAARQVVEAHADYVASKFGAGAISLFFPQMSPDGSRVYFKMASPREGGMRSEKASVRDGLFVYDIARGKLLGRNDFWGHPAWYSDSRQIQSCQFVTDTDTMQVRALPNIPMPFGGVHASPNVDRTLVVTDISKKDYLTPRNHWTIWLIDPRTGAHETLHIAGVEGDGTTSWRPAHPHPAFNARGNRIYFNVIAKPWTSLHVIERKENPS